MPAVISQTVLVLAESFDKDLSARGAASAIGRGLRSDGRLECDVCAVEDSSPTVRGLLEELDFDRRMRAARAVVIATGRLDDRTLAGSLAFEAATRARQAGVPAFAVTARNELDPFEARIVDLQVVLQAGTTRALAAAGRRLGELV